MQPQFDAYYKWLGIPSSDQPPNYYRLLGIELFENDVDVVENAAEQRMRHIRTFQQGPFQSHSQQLLNEIATAKLCLLKPTQKAIYDGKLKESLAAATLSPTANSLISVGKMDPQIHTTGQSRKPKNAFLEFAKIVVGGLGGLFVAWWILSSLRPGLRDARGTSNSIQVARPSTLPTKSDETNAKSETVGIDDGNRAVNSPPPTSGSPHDAVLPAVYGSVSATTNFWGNGEAAITLGSSKDSFLVTSSIAGHFLGNGEWFESDIDSKQNYQLRGGGARPVRVSVTQVATPFRAWFEEEVEHVEWHKGTARVRLVHQYDGFAVLSGVSGCFLGPEHAISVSIDPNDGYWYLNGSTNFETKGHALVYRFKQPGKFRAEVRQFDWKAGVEKERMISAQDGLCFVSGIGGAFHGFGENLNAILDADGDWHAWGSSQAHTTSGSFICIRFTTRDIVALGSGQSADATPAVIAADESVEAPQLSQSRVSQPAETDVAEARVKLRDTVLSAETEALFDLARAPCPAAEAFVLHQAARDRAIALGDCLGTMRALDRLAEQFQVDLFALQVESLHRLRDSCRAPIANRQLAMAGIQKFDEAVGRGDKSGLLPLAELCVAASRKSEDAELIRQATLRLIEAKK